MGTIDLDGAGSGGSGDTGGKGMSKGILASFYEVDREESIWTQRLEVIPRVGEQIILYSLDRSKVWIVVEVTHYLSFMSGTGERQDVNILVKKR